MQSISKDAKRFVSTAIKYVISDLTELSLRRNTDGFDQMRLLPLVSILLAFPFSILTMDKRYQEFKHRIDKKLVAMNAPISYMRKGMDGLHVALEEFKDEFDMFIDFSSENHTDHERRIRAMEKGR